MLERTYGDDSFFMAFFADNLEVLPLNDRYIAAGNELTSEDLLTRLAFDGIDCIRQHVAENPNTPEVILCQLAFDSCIDVRISVADHPRTPLSIIEILAQDSCVDVRFSIAENHNVPDYVLRILTHDDNPFVACRAKQTLEHNLLTRSCRAA